MTESHWNRLYQNSPVQKPERPRHEQVAAGVTKQLSAIDGRILLLGASPTLSRIGSDLIAVDRNRGRGAERGGLAIPKPGGGSLRTGCNFPFPAGSFAACIGDGTANALPWPGRLDRCTRACLVCCALVARSSAAPTSRPMLARLSPTSRGRNSAGPMQQLRLFQVSIGNGNRRRAIGPKCPGAIDLTCIQYVFPDRGRLPG